MNKILTWVVSKVMPCELDGVRVLMVPGLGDHVEVVFASDEFHFWGDTALLIDDDREFLAICRNAIIGACWHLNEVNPLEIHVSWGLFQKMRNAVKAEKKSGALSEV